MKASTSRNIARKSCVTQCSKKASEENFIVKSSKFAVSAAVATALLVRSCNTAIREYQLADYS